MGKRFVVVGGATAVAGLVLGASIVLGPPAVKSEDPDLPGDIGAPTVGDPTSNPDDIRVNIEGFDYSTFELDSDGQLRGTRLRATRTNLKPQGITELIKPHAVIRLGPQRAITITADKADMEMEDSKPRQGRFTGNVVVTIAEAPVGTELILEEPASEDDADKEDSQRLAHEPFIQQRIYLDEATDFSIEDDTINTRGPVHVTSNQVDFFGIGLRLAYNTQRERIEQLIITEGRYLIVNPDAEAAGFTKPSDAEAEQPEASDRDPETVVPKQFYAATFQRDVLVRDGLVSQLAGQTLTIDFSLGTDAINVKPITPDTTGRLPGLIPVGQLAQSDAEASAALPVLVIPKKNLQRTLLTHDPERDILITWAGELSVLPHANRPDALADDDDAMLTLTGPNAYAQSTRNGEVERLETPRLEYLLSEERTTAYASDQKALRILSDALGGQITGQQLIVRQNAGTATILGPGELTYTNDEDGKTLKLTWQHRLDLELYTQAKNADAANPSELEAPGADRSQTKILGVKTATFDGDVTARHTDFDLDSDKLTLEFAKPDKANGIDNTPTAINASGSVVIQARGEEADETFDITAGRLSIDLKLDEDSEPYASAIRAVDGVTVKQPGSELTCNRVSVELSPPSQADADAAIDERFAQVRSILAVGNVAAKLDNDGRRVDLVADQLFADVEKDKLTLAADTDNALAEITDLSSGRSITGRLIEMDDKAQALAITGPGTLATVIDDPNNEGAGIEDAFLSIAWTKAMSFNNITGQAEFYENVRTESRRSTDASEMTCDTLTMLFDPDNNPAGLLDRQDAKDNDKKDEDANPRQIKSAVATGNVKFLASAWDPDKPKKILNRVQLQGPKIVITNQPAIETMAVQGKGLMTLEDYRPPKEKDADNKASLTGRGMTLFRWTDSMALDAQANTANLLGQVQMTHIPKDENGKEGDPVQLDCNQLLADMTDNGGMSVWLADDAPDAQIKTITATDNVRLLQQGTRSMRGDVMTFDAEKNLVTLETNNGRDVVLEDLDRDTSTRTNKVTWDLTTDRIEIDKLRGGVAPLN